MSPLKTIRIWRCVSAVGARAWRFRSQSHLSAPVKRPAWEGWREVHRKVVGKAHQEPGELVAVRRDPSQPGPL